MSDYLLDAGLIQAYRQTHFKAASGLTLLVDQPNPALARAQRQRGSDCSAFITACNPESVELTPDHNARRQADLASALEQRGLDFVEGIGQHPSNQWAGEASFLVFGLPLDQAKALGSQLRQNAIIWSGADGVPRLILLR